MGADLVRISKFISLVLRHEPAAAGLELDPQGWASVDALIAGAGRAGLVIDRSILEAVMAANDKRRFEISADGAAIRATHGHSVAVETVDSPLAPPDRLLHGTADRFLASIRAEGLRPGERQFVHLSETVEMARTVGGRHGRPAIIVVDTGAMARDGFLFYRSSSGVWLTRNVPPAYLSDLVPET
ncbi:RNA 2'-phosphotransferase [Prosthecomicrobium pneumaticum]|uniref:Probable RNA 2'-phosphotransferase n=1 Tax=Prosthecomicrobium pneumaticum TaxID=81895 RepID=A0A7W9FPJ4_9HYPH|nr:RNA 2'-phosphotransferase [Prosthecomicrobium pneumaticum]MBB5754406.1 putative RNA 2'-phosphotransferase [Prosthecomicrobium pneumaticum]